MKILNGNELAGFIKQRQAQEVRSLIHGSKITPKLAIVYTMHDPVINTYIRLKKSYGGDIQVDVEIHKVDQHLISETIKKLNEDNSIHGIIIQLPLENPTETDEIVKKVSPTKDVDALGSDAIFAPATPTAILWLLAGYNITLQDKKILLIGKGKLVGAPLEKMLMVSHMDVTVADRSVKNLEKMTLDADIIITATGSPAILFSNMVKDKAVVVDAGVASEDGKTVGDVAADVYERNDLTLTPTKGGVGPLTVCSLFENVIRAAKLQVGTDN
ncbi:MAG: bifunctional methylenetetrahydrofolate dehydrogenase/methenyltetrahydrofolate cyclohydrolase [Candidatus Saccharimonadales bacterium]